MDASRPTNVVKVYLQASKGWKECGNVDLHYHDYRRGKPRALVTVDEDLYREFAFHIREPRMTRKEKVRLFLFSAVTFGPIIAGQVFDPDGQLGKYGWFIAALVAYYVVVLGLWVVMLRQSSEKYRGHCRHVLELLEQRFAEAGYSAEYHSRWEFPFGGLWYVAFTPIGSLPFEHRFSDEECGAP